MAHCTEAHGYDLGELHRRQRSGASEGRGQKPIPTGPFRACKAIRLVRQGLRAGAGVDQPHRLCGDIPLRRARRVAQAWRRAGVGRHGERDRRRGSHEGHDGCGPALLAGDKGVRPGSPWATFFVRPSRRSASPTPPRSTCTPRSSAWNSRAAERAREAERARFLGARSLATHRPPAAAGRGAGGRRAGRGARVDGRQPDAGKEGTEARDAELARVAEEAQRLKDQLVTAVDADSDAFQGFMDALRCPRARPRRRRSARARCRRA